MKKQDEEVVGMIVLFIMAFIFLFCGSLAWDLGEEGKAIVLIMCSLYVAMYIHAGMIATLVNAKFEDRKKEISNNSIVGKAP